jgi:SpoIIAA-like
MSGILRRGRHLQLLRLFEHFGLPEPGAAVGAQANKNSAKPSPCFRRQPFGATAGRLQHWNAEALLMPEKSLYEPARKIPMNCHLCQSGASIDAGAMWEDFKVGVEHLTRWERAAVVTDVEWIREAMRLFSFFMPGAMKAFPTSEAEQARAWIAAPA